VKKKKRHELALPISCSISIEFIPLFRCLLGTKFVNKIVWRYLCANFGGSGLRSGRKNFLIEVRLSYKLLP
jgi:hypothetical protein